MIETGLERLDPVVGVTHRADPLGAPYAIPVEVVVGIHEARKDEVTVEVDRVGARGAVQRDQPAGRVERPPFDAIGLDDRGAADRERGCGEPRPVTAHGTAASQRSNRDGARLRLRAAATGLHSYQNG